MKNLKMNLLKNSIVLVIWLVSTVALAQDRKPTEEQKAEFQKQLAIYLEELDLSEDQKIKFEEISKKYARQMKSLRDSDKGRLAKYKELKSIQKNKNEEMEVLLSEEQYEVYERMQEERMQKMKERRKNKN